ncbi:hypothetical protein BGX28_005358 [Mortierella sp. GBA30]|nr:hypothetical protein BGX28_005358 [Mortierella sp. GBA30]
MDPIDPAIHGLLPTTTNTLEPAPEVLLTRGYEKRSLAALEPEFVDSNDINATAPSSAVLQSDFLIIDDDHNLEEKVDMSDRVILSSVSSSTPPRPPLKRPRFSSVQLEPTSSDYAQLQPVIQPDSKREPGDQHGHGHGHNLQHSLSHRQQQDRAERTHSLSRRRSIADLVHPSNQRSPVYVDEPEATTVYGEPMDSSSGTLALEPFEEDHPPTPGLSSKYPGSGALATGGSAPEHPMRKGLRFNPMRRDTSKSNTGGSSYNNRRNSTTQDSRHSTASKLSSSSSSLFVPSSHASGPLEHKRNSISCTKKGPQRPVRIQLLDEAESEKIREQSRQTELSNADLALSQQSSQQLQELDQDPYQRDEDVGETNSDSDIALPKEDPIVHDWDREELEDEESGYGTPTVTTGSSTPQSVTSSQLHDHNISIDSRTLNDNSTQENQRNKNKDDDDQDPLCDPEREVAVMSESEEAELHNMHVRLENQREFQDAAGLDLGEDDAQALNEDGRYGGAIEDDDEGEDYWENR